MYHKSMENYDQIEEDKDLKKVGLELMFLTPEKCSSSDGITAVELAKLVGLPAETVKKKLNILKEKEIVKVKGINPKYWKFNEYNFQRNPRADLLQNGLVGSPCSPRNSQESSPTPQFKSINSLVLSLLHSPTLTSIHDHRKNHSLD